MEFGAFTDRITPTLQYCTFCETTGLYFLHMLKFIMNWITLKDELRFSFQSQIQFTENSAKFTTETVFALYQHQRLRAKMCPPFEEIQVWKPRRI